MLRYQSQILNLFTQNNSKNVVKQRNYCGTIASFARIRLIKIFIVIQGMNRVSSDVMNWTFMAPRFYRRSFMEPRTKKQTTQPANKMN